MGDHREAIKLGLVGIGKIARDSHVPAIEADARFALIATASRHAGLAGVPGHRDIAAMLAAHPEIAAVSLCTPPQGRFEIAMTAIEACRHVMLEKPPAATLTEAQALAAAARAAGVTLFASWHSREAAGVAAARRWCARGPLRQVRIDWREDIRHWHPGQEWILAAGGFGVFDPGINALSILTAILPDPVTLTGARLDFPEGRDAPIAADLTMASAGVPIAAGFDFLQTGAQTWTIAVEADHGTLVLADGGSRLAIDGAAVAPDASAGEYPRLYARFADLVAAGESDADFAPLALCADAFLVGERRTVAPFTF